MRKLIAIGVALCIFAMLVSTASACIPGVDPGCDNFISKPYVKVPTTDPGTRNIAFGGQTSGTAYSFGGCTNDAQVGTTAGANSASSGFSVTDSYATGSGINYADATGGSGFNSV